MKLAWLLPIAAALALVTVTAAVACGNCAQTQPAPYCCTPAMPGAGPAPCAVPVVTMIPGRITYVYPFAPPGCPGAVQTYSVWVAQPCPCAVPCPAPSCYPRGY